MYTRVVFASFNRIVREDSIIKFIRKGMEWNGMISVGTRVESHNLLFGATENTFTLFSFSMSQSVSKFVY